MKLNKFNKSVSTSPNKTLGKLNKKKSIIKKPISIKLPSFLNLNEILESKQDNKINDRYYYKNPQFLNSSNIQNQIDILLTNFNNNTHNTIIKNDSSNSLKILPKIKSLKNLKTNANLNNEKSRKTSFDSSLYNNNNINRFPVISASTSHFNNKRLSINNSNDSEQKIRDIEFDYKSIFSSSKLFKEKNRYIDNKLNIVYCQNEAQYKLIMERRNKLLKKGSVLKFGEDSEKVKEQVNDIKDKIKFMKNVMDYSYPGFMLTKIKQWEKHLASQKTDDIPTPYENQKNQIKRRNILRTNYLKQNLKIYPIKI